jgi:hypothetical protein
MNVEIGAEAAQFPEKEYRNGIAVAVCVLVSYSVLTLIEFDISLFGKTEKIILFVRIYFGLCTTYLIF